MFALPLGYFYENSSDLVWYSVRRRGNRLPIYGYDGHFMLASRNSRQKLMVDARLFSRILDLKHLHLAQ